MAGFNYEEKKALFASKMEKENLSDAFINQWRSLFKELADGSTGCIPEADIEPVASLPKLNKAIIKRP